VDLFANKQLHRFKGPNYKINKWGQNTLLINPLKIANWGQNPLLGRAATRCSSHPEDPKIRATGHRQKQARRSGPEPFDERWLLTRPRPMLCLRRALWARL
jgi:hypothetical protein